MDILLDTHAIIWVVSNPSQIPEQTLALIDSADNTCYVSIASFWEIAIKYSIGRLDLDNTIEDSFQSIINSGFEILPISTKHILKVSNMPSS